MLSAPPSHLAALARSQVFAPLPPVLELAALATLRHVCVVRLGRYGSSLDEDEEAALALEQQQRRREEQEDQQEGQQEEEGAEACGAQCGAPAAARQAGRAAGRVAAGRLAALRLRVSEQRAIERSLEAAEERVAAVRRAEAARGAGGRRVARKSRSRGGGSGEHAGSGQPAAASAGGRPKGAAGAAPAGGRGESARRGGAGALPASAELVAELEAAARGVPPLRWSQSATHVHVTVRLRRLETLSPPTLSGRSLHLCVRGRSGPSGSGDPRGVYNATLELWGMPLPLRATDIMAGGSLLRLSLRKPDEGAQGVEPGGGGVGEFGEGAGEWPRLLEHRELEELLRRRGTVGPDLDAVSRALEEAEAEEQESRCGRLPPLVHARTAPWVQ